MKREGAIGTAALLALAAAVGISVQPGSRQTTPGGSHGRGAPTRHAKGNECDELRKHLEEFLDAEGRLSPTPCEQGNVTRLPAEETAHLKFVIATLPDPLHTHLAVSFDESIAAIQEAAQDEGYDFDSSWLPWQQEEEKNYTHLEDQKTADQEREDRENQPGILLFRKSGVDESELRDSAGPSSLSTPASARPENEPQLNPQQKSARPQNPAPKARDFTNEGKYRHGLVIFVVGEDATHGIHRLQFQNALQWIAMFGGEELGHQGRVAILGPSFSGSFPSLAEILSHAETAKQLGITGDTNNRPLPIYAGGVSGATSAAWFQGRMDEGQTAPRVLFHSFVANDDQMVERFLEYLGGAQQHFDYRKVAVLSEDETAYGQDVMRGSSPREDVLRLYYPRDISAVREAYQSKSLFDSATSEGSQNQVQKALPTDLADPAGIVHDSVHTYGANQTPLAQEAFLLEIATSLRERGVRYVLLRGSNPLDQLFLTNFLRRLYPDARIVIVMSDLLFIRARGATGLSGVMTLSTYPLSPLARHWTESPLLAPSDRIFSSDSSEGLYNAFRLLINADLPDQTLPNPCHVSEPAWGTDPLVWRHTAESDSNIFLPTVVCTRTPIADYAPPLWVNSSSCASTENGPICSYSGPVVWLSVIGANRFWPLLPLPSKSLASKIDDPDEKSVASEKKLELPLSMKLFWMALLFFSIFHLWCCWQGSYMAKPAFRAYFAASGDPKQSALIWLGSSVVIFLGLIAAWSCGVFARPTIVMPNSLLAHGAAVAVVLLAWSACLLHYCRFDQLNPAERASEKSPGSSDRPESAPQKPARETLAAATYRRLRSWASKPLYRIFLTGLFPLLSVLLFVRISIIPLESALQPENRVLTYWRSMNLWNGLSPVVPFFSLFIGLYVVFWYALHGLSLFGPDRPRLPRAKQLEIPIIHPAKPAEPNPSNPPPAEKQQGEDKEETLVLRMFTQDTADEIEFAAKPMTPARRTRTRPKKAKEQAQVRLVTKLPLTAFVFVLSGAMAAAFAAGVPIRSLGHQNYAIVFLVWFLFCAGLMTALCWRMYATWAALRQLLEYLDRMPLRRTMEALRGFSWGNVWKMSGNVLEVRYKLISRQMESMNHTIASLDKLNFCHESLATPEAAAASRKSLGAMREAGQDFAKWYLENYTNPDAGDLHYFRTFQKRVANVCGCLLRNILLPAWKDENHSLILGSPPESETQGSERPAGPPAKEELLRNAEEFVCLTYMGFVQNILGRLRTMAVSIVALFVACCAAISAYPFDPRQALSGVLIALFGVSFASILFVYAGMHRDSTLSRVTNTTPGELGSEFWMKLLVFIAPPLLGLLARVFPGTTDFLFSWLQPGISSLK